MEAICGGCALGRAFVLRRFILFFFAGLSQQVSRARRSASWTSTMEAGAQHRAARSALRILDRLGRSRSCFTRIQSSAYSRRWDHTLSGGHAWHGRPTEPAVCVCVYIDVVGRCRLRQDTQAVRLGAHALGCQCSLAAPRVSARTKPACFRQSKRRRLARPPLAGPGGPCPAATASIGDRESRRSIARRQLRRKRRRPRRAAATGSERPTVAAGGRVGGAGATAAAPAGLGQPPPARRRALRASVLRIGPWRGIRRLG